MRLSTSLPFLLALALLLEAVVPTSAQGEPEPVIVRASVSPDSNLVVGQRVVLNVDVLTSTWFPRAPILSDVRIAGVIVLRTDSFGVNLNERIGRTSYAGTRQRLSLFPQRAGEYTVPPVEVRVVYAIDGRPSEEQVFLSPTVAFAVEMPEAARQAGLESMVATRQLQLDDRFDRDIPERPESPDDEPAPVLLTVGDSLQRTVTARAADAVSMLLPPIHFEIVAIDQATTEVAGDVIGASVYPDTPQLDERTNRGRLSASRIDSATFVFEQPGRYRLPKIEVPWWNLGSGRLETELLPALDIVVHDAPTGEALSIGFEETEAEADEDASVQASWWPPDARTLLLLAAVTLALWWLGRWLRARLPAWRQQRHLRSEEHRHSEPVLFRQLQLVALRGDATGLLRALYRWLDRAWREAALDEQAATLRGLARYRPLLRNQLLALRSKLYARPESEEQILADEALDPRLLAKELRQARRQRTPGLRQRKSKNRLANLRP